ncbi:MAG: hypothetical protein ABWY04_12340 [Arthrobacter sp.]
MKQPSASGIGFREVDQDENPAVHVPDTAQDSSRQDRHWSVNPFIAVLWLVAAVLVVGGISVLSTVTFNPGPVGGPQAITFLMMTFAPHALLVGLVVVLCLLFWHAWQWQRRHSKRPTR